MPTSSTPTPTPTPTVGRKCMLYSNMVVAIHFPEVRFVVDGLTYSKKPPETKRENKKMLVGISKRFFR